MKHYLLKLEESVQRFWNEPALCDYKGESFSFGEMATEMKRLEMFYDAIGVGAGAHVALCAKNTARWAVAFLSGAAHGCVMVPILADFHPESVNRLVDHSDAVLLFADREIWARLDMALMPQLKGVVATDDFGLLYAADESVRLAYESCDERLRAAFPLGYDSEYVRFKTDNMKELAVINYTSGTTSEPKGVMLMNEALSASIDFGHRNIPVSAEDRIVSMLPMAHIYGMVYELLYPLSRGCTVYYLGKTPAPSVLLAAMREVKPFLVCTVPLVMEKVYRSAIHPKLHPWYMHLLRSLPVVKRVVNGKVREALDAAFGGRVRCYIMGGAALNPQVERCFKEIGLHFTVGYGMTEAAPLLAYEDWRCFAAGSCGKPVDSADVRIDSDDPLRVVGEIQAKGKNICVGYYKNEAATAAAFTDDGYLRTGDLGVMDERGNLYIRGRSKNMILGANGQNIYPEEVEAVVNSRRYVAESLVVERGGRLTALVVLDKERMVRDGLVLGSQVEDVVAEIKEGSNRHLPAYSRIASVEVRSEPFEKTPKMSIKRFLYMGE